MDGQRLAGCPLTKGVRPVPPSPAVCPGWKSVAATLVRFHQLGGSGRNVCSMPQQTSPTLQPPEVLFLKLSKWIEQKGPTMQHLRSSNIALGLLSGCMSISVEQQSQTKTRGALVHEGASAFPEAFSQSFQVPRIVKST